MVEGSISITVRAHITITDREGLKASANGTYHEPEEL
jgi:hypothetical protein